MVFIHPEYASGQERVNNVAVVHVNEFNQQLFILMRK